MQDVDNLAKMKTSRVDFILQLDDDTIIGADLFRAAVQCLCLEEAMALLLHGLTLSAERRRKVALRIAELAKIPENLPAIEILVTHLVTLGDDKRLRRKFLYPARIIVEELSDAAVAEVISSLLDFRDKFSLDHASFLMAKFWHPGHIDALRRLTLEQHTHRSLSLLIAKGSITLLSQLIGEVALLEDKDFFRKCVTRLAENPDVVLPLAKKFGACEELYARFKIGAWPIEAEARELLHESFGERDYRLAIWCVGRFGYFELIRELYELRDQFNSRLTLSMRT